ncbi:hypothetical protein [Lutibacter sp.]|uniref:hypothetical protein n=1 Tax=Lutibacter sp. TaxID=1925666 RepID=UPI0027337081|nr:hypothetical protein [Lutibacter sp.]MDP3313159.1 hypothetical protein [Lutibacter sp.]
MEFFRIIDKQVSEKIIQDNINPQRLEDFTESMFLLEDLNNNFLGGTLWGEFNISYDKINGGVRFTLLDCPNALSWTITTGFPPERNKIVMHATINRTQKATEFIDEIQEFLDEWEQGLRAQF